MLLRKAAVRVELARAALDRCGAAGVPISTTTNQNAMSGAAAQLPL